MSRKSLSIWVIFLLIIQAFAGTVILFPRLFQTEKAYAATQTNSPTSDDSTTAGTWTGSAGSRYTLVDDHPDSGGTDYITHGTTAGNLTFGFSAFNIPAESTITSVQVIYYDQKASTQANNIAARLKVGDSYYNASTHNTTNNTWVLRTDTWANNPKSGTNWTIDDVNGVSVNALQAFGWNSTDASPVVYLSSIMIQVNYEEPATLSISAPNNITVAENSSYNITYTLVDSDSVATAAFYYDTNNDMAGGTAISGACATAVEGSGATCSWDTTGVSPGTYYIYGVTSATPTAVSALSPGTITINDKPALSISAPPSGNNSAGATYNITYTLADSDDVVTAAFYYDTNNDGAGGVAITGCETKAEGSDATCVFDTSVLSAGTPYYIYAVTSGDIVNSAVTTISAGTITTNNAPNVPSLVSPANGSSTTDNTPTLSASYSDSDTGDTGTTNYRIASTNASDCLNNSNIVASGTSAETATNNENTAWTPASSVGVDGTYYWCAQNNDGSLTSSWTSMGNLILDTAAPSGGSISYADGYNTTGSVSLTASDGTDPVSGINTATRTVQRKSATYSGGNCGSYGSFATITPTGTYPDFTDSTVLSGNCYQYQYLVSDNAGNQATYTSANAVKVDTASPSGGSIIYADGYNTTGSVSLTASDGTDSVSGINTSTRTVQRKSATLFGESCGVYGSFETITPTGSYPNFIDATLISGFCYQYQYLVSDNAGNQETYTSTNAVKTDLNAPTGGSIGYSDQIQNNTTVSLTASDGTDALSGINTATRTVQRKSATYSGGNCGSYGSFATITPTGSYPDYTDSSVASGNCYQYQYLVSDNAGNQATYTSANAVKVDTASPSGGSISYADGYNTTGSVSLTASDGTDSVSEINTNTRTVQRKSATLSGGNCGSYGSFATITPTGTYPDFTDSTVLSGNCYQYQYLVSDNAGNQATYTSANAVKVDTASPSGGSISYADGTYSSASVPLTLNDGTDDLSGINTTTRIIQRKSATYSGGNCGSYGSFATITPTGSYPDYTDTTVEADYCYQYQYLVSDNAGNQATFTSANTVKVEILDATPPSGGSITYTNGTFTNLSISLTADDGSDPESGINTATRTVQRKSATLSGGNCGSYGSFATITPTGSYPNYTDTSVTSNNCYQYQYLVSNNAGLQATYTSNNVAKVDAASPSGGSLNYTDGYYTSASVGLTASDGTDAGFGINTATRTVQRKSATLSGGNCGSYGSFATITPTGTYPNFTDATVVSGNCYQYQYLVSDNAGNQATYTSANTVKVDSAGPSGGSISYADGYEISGSANLTASDGTDSAAGINTSTRTVQRKSATLTGGVCGSYGSFATITPTGTYPNFTDATVVSGNCYQYQYLVSDNAGNQATYTSINTVKVDTAGPTNVGVSNIAVDSKTQLTVTANIPTDSASGIHATPYWFEETSNNSGGSDSASWQSGNTFVDSGLSANTQYTYRTKAKDVLNNESAFSATVSKYTLANQVTSVLATDTSTKDSYSINLSWTNQGQSGIKIEKDTGCNGYETTEYDNPSSTPSSPRSISVSANTCYRFRISSYNGDGIINSQDALPQSNQLTTPPAQPTGLTHTGNTISSISWDWNDVAGATGYKIYRSSDDSLLQTIATATSQWTQGSLSSDTQYSVYVRPTNANGEGMASLAASAYTSANAPINPTHSANTTDSITWGWTSGGNQKDFYAWTTTPAANSGWIFDLSWAQGSLSANSLYQFFVKARNEENDETSSATASHFTSQNTPTGISFGAITANSITLSAQGTLPNLSSNSSGLYFTNNTALQNSGWIQTNSWNNSALLPNTQYAYQVKSRNGDADESDYAAEETKYTLANTPGAPILSEADYNAMKLTLNANSNPAATEFAIFETSTGNYVDSSDGSLDLASAQWQTYANWGGASGITVTGLSPNLTYTFRVKARNGENIETTLGTSASLATLVMPVPPNAPVLVSPANLSYTSNTTPTFTARYSDNNFGDTGTTNYRLSSTSSSDCTNNLNIIDSGTSAETSTNDENTSWTPSVPLAVDQNYYWCAENNDGTDSSAWTSMGSFSLDTQSPTGTALSLGGVTATSITTLVSGTTDSGSGLHSAPYYFLNGSKPSNSGWQASDTWISSALIPNTAYSLQVKARDAIGNESDYTIAQSYRTLANLPSGFTLAANTTSQITANWNTNSNPAGTEYYVENITEGTNSDWITATSWASSGLSAQTNYTFRVKARNLAGIETAWSSETSRITLSLAPLVIESDDDDDDDTDSDHKSDSVIRQVVSDLPYYISNLPAEINTLLDKETPESLAPKIAPVSMQGTWNLVYAQPLMNFLSAYPEDIEIAVAKFPEFEKLFFSINSPGLSEMEQLENYELILPGLNKLALSKTEESEFHSSVPLSMFSAEMKEKIPNEIIFAQAGGGAIDLPVNISSDDEGASVQTITSVSGKTIRLAIKPQGKVLNIKGYLLLKDSAQSSAIIQQSEAPLDSDWKAIWRSTFKYMAYPLSAYASGTPDAGTRLMLSEFEFTDPDGDGIFEVEIESPIPDGQYEVITIISYADRRLGQKELRLITVIDPEGYVFRKIEGEELRIRNAVVSLYSFNQSAGQFELWAAENYQQTNPQITNSTGKYSFLAPAGKYYLKIEAPGYKDYIGKEFLLTEGESVHENIELQKKSALIDYFNLKNLAIFLMASALGTNLWMGRRKKIN